MEGSFWLLLIAVAIVVIGAWLLARRSRNSDTYGGRSSPARTAPASPPRDKTFPPVLPQGKPGTTESPKRSTEFPPQGQAATNLPDRASVDEEDVTHPTHDTDLLPPPGLQDWLGEQSQQSQPPKPASVAPPAVPTEEVRFTAFHPKEATVETWYTLLVYAHIESASDKVQTDAAKFKDEMGGKPKQVLGSAPAKLARGTAVTIVPECAGVTFNPERIGFKWVEDLHRAEFRMKANKSLAGDAGKGMITVYVGPLIVATLKLAMLFEEAGPTSLKIPSTAEISAHIYRQEQIFASYSHKDSAVVMACRDAYKALGYDVLIDIDSLRSGENWNAKLMELIDRADIFQMFWSTHYAQSQHCRMEWEHAIQKASAKDGGFIRPVYWEKPFPTPPDELAALHFAYVPLGKPDNAGG